MYSQKLHFSAKSITTIYNLNTVMKEHVHCIADNTVYGGEREIQLNTNDAKAVYEIVTDDEKVCYLFAFIIILNAHIYFREWHMKFPKISAPFSTALFKTK